MRRCSVKLWSPPNRQITNFTWHNFNLLSDLDDVTFLKSEASIWNWRNVFFNLQVSLKFETATVVAPLIWRGWVWVQLRVAHHSCSTHEGSWALITWMVIYGNVVARFAWTRPCRSVIIVNLSLYHVIFTKWASVLAQVVNCCVYKASKRRPWSWSSGQHAHLLIRQSEFESRWSLQFFL